MKNKLKKLYGSPRTLAVDILFDIVGCVLYGAGIYNFAYASDFAPGGVSGLAILVNTLTKGLPFAPNGIPIGLAMLLINVPIVLICYRALGAAYFARSV